MTERTTALCERLRRLGYAQNNQVRLYGEEFDLVSDPITLGEHLIVVDAIERKSGHLRRVRIPLNIVHIAKQELPAA